MTITDSGYRQGRVLADHDPCGTSHRHDARALIVITTCNRSDMVRNFAPDFHRFCQNDRRYDFVLSIDGAEVGSNPDTLQFALEQKIAFLQSDQPEGVGISKNRVLRKLDGYDYYFFAEDDVQLCDARVFDTCISVSQATGIHHFSFHEPERIREIVSTSVWEGREIIHARYGSAQVSFYTGASLRKAGGWHPRFARWRRGGHTEHSYRIHRQGLAPAPFNIISSCLKCFAWNNPTSVVDSDHMPITKDGILIDEQSLIDEDLGYVEISTPSPFQLIVPSVVGEDALV